MLGDFAVLFLVFLAGLVAIGIASDVIDWRRTRRESRNRNHARPWRWDE